MKSSAKAVPALPPEQRDAPINKLLDSTLPSIEALQRLIQEKYPIDNVSARALVWQALRKKYIF